MKACCKINSDYGLTMSVAIYSLKVPSMWTSDFLVNANLFHFMPILLLLKFSALSRTKTFIRHRECHTKQSCYSASEKKNLSLPDAFV